ncbi:hypothetical protein KBX35_20985 [Micromonospora sp. C32]|uniref:hypothetical protein n=1 Tax=Micromonospora sp. C32 TaxID=2824877 RepID=UPI001B358F76|nr:hypothetical protein [Micromonospora sp. C32]MBQ1057264.1 hypothetical protein [Micromonospora sp. C32]
MRAPRPGDLLRVDGRASVQFGGDRALTFRVVSVGAEVTHMGWLWLTGYVLDSRGSATAKREIFVRLAGLRRADEPLPRCQSCVPANRVQASISVGARGRAGR